MEIIFLLNLASKFDVIKNRFQFELKTKPYKFHKPAKHGVYFAVLIDDNCDTKSRAVKATGVTASHYFSQQARAIDLLAATKVEIRKKTASSLSRRPKENTKRPIYL